MNSEPVLKSWILRLKKLVELKGNNPNARPSTIAQIDRDILTLKSKINNYGRTSNVSEIRYYVAGIFKHYKVYINATDDLEIDFLMKKFADENNLAISRYTHKPLPLMKVIK